MRPYMWLRPELVPPALFFQCHPGLTPGGSGVLADSARIDEEFCRAWLPYFCRSGRREAGLEEFDAEVEGWLPLLPEVHLAPFTGADLPGVVRRDVCYSWQLYMGGVGGSSKSCQQCWFDGLARVVAGVEEGGVWPEGLLDSCIAMIPEGWW